MRLKPLLSTWKPYGLDAPPPESGLPDFHGLSRGFIPRRIRWIDAARRIGAVETAPQRMEALRAGRHTPNESGLPDFHDLSRGFIPWRIRRIGAARRIRRIGAARRIWRIGAARRIRRIGAVETAPQRMEALRAGRLTPTGRVYPTYMP